MTPVGERLRENLEKEHVRMLNEWFFKWHFIGRDGPVEIDGFDGRTINYGGVKFNGTPRDVYWDTIQRYTRSKLSEYVTQIENELKNYPVEIRKAILDETETALKQFVSRIRKATVEKDRILRGDGIKFPSSEDIGNWKGTSNEDIESRLSNLANLYYYTELMRGLAIMPFKSRQNDIVTLVKKDGNVFKENIKCIITNGKVQVHDSRIPFENGDHLLRSLPNGLSEEYIIENAQFNSGLGPIEPFYILEVRRSDAAVAQQASIIQNITNNLHGNNSRITIGNDNSVNSRGEIDLVGVVSIIEQIKNLAPLLPLEMQKEVINSVGLAEKELKADQPSGSKVIEILKSIRTVGEGVTGNVIASGIVTVISNFLPS
ncbi:hypothetical protein ACTOV4_10205 [Brucella sp. C7-11G]